MTIHANLLAITMALYFGSSLAKAGDIEIPGPLAALTYQDQLVACSYFFGEMASAEAMFDDNVEIRKIAVTDYLRKMNMVLVPQNELIPGPRARAAEAIGKAATRSKSGAEVMDRYCSRAVLAGTRWMSKDDREKIERIGESNYTHMRPPFLR